MTHSPTTQTDHDTIRSLVDDFHHSLDDRHLDDEWAERFLTDDVRFDMPVGSDQGRADVLAQTQRGIFAFARTVHFGTNLVIEVGGDSANVRWNALCTHVHDTTTSELFVSAGRYHGVVRRDGDRWRFAELGLDLAWTQGRPPEPASAA